MSKTNFLKSMLLPIYRWYKTSLLSFTWLRQACIARKTKDNIHLCERDITSAIILAPHSDDEWIGCSSFIQKIDHLIICDMDMPGGDDIQTHTARKKEMQKMASRYGRKLVVVDKSDRVNSLKEILRQYHLSMIFVPYYIDWHEEHIATMKALNDALPSDEEIYVAMYQVTCPLVPEDINYISPLNFFDWAKKWFLFNNTYKTQNNFPDHRIAWCEYVSGKYCNSFAAEVFSIEKASEWKKNIKFTLNEGEQELIKKNLNNIIHNRIVIRKLWELRNTEGIKNEISKNKEYN